jgi:hypothetical protein
LEIDLWAHLKLTRYDEVGLSDVGEDSHLRPDVAFEKERLDWYHMISDGCNLEEPGYDHRPENIVGRSYELVQVDETVAVQSENESR